MKKTIISLALATIAIFGTSTVFAQQTADNKKSEKTERRNFERPQQANPFEGLNLTEQQQAALKALDEEQKAEMTKKREAEKADRQNEKKDRKAEMMKARKAKLDKIKEILTPEQYNQFLENNYLRQGGKATPDARGKMYKKGGNKHFGNKDGKAGRDGKKNRKSSVKRQNNQKEA